MLQTRLTTLETAALLGHVRTPRQLGVEPLLVALRAASQLAAPQLRPLSDMSAALAAARGAAAAGTGFRCLSGPQLVELLIGGPWPRGSSLRWLLREAARMFWALASRVARPPAASSAETRSDAAGTAFDETFPARLASAVDLRLLVLFVADPYAAGPAIAPAVLALTAMHARGALQRAACGGTATSGFEVAAAPGAELLRAACACLARRVSEQAAAPREPGDDAGAVLDAALCACIFGCAPPPPQQQHQQQSHAEALMPLAVEGRRRSLATGRLCADSARAEAGEAAIGRQPRQHVVMTCQRFGYGVIDLLCT
jgi:hypothetical protein